MKHAILFLMIVAGGFQAPAASKTAAAKKTSAPSACEDCKTAEKLTADTRKLDAKNDDDAFKGGENARAGAQLALKIEKMKAPVRAKLFAAVLPLAREVGPYDTEGQMTEVLSSLILKDAALKSDYEASQKTALASSKGADLCKAKLLEAGVKERLCDAKAGATGQDVKNKKQEEQVAKCVSDFDYDKCLAKK